MAWAVGDTLEISCISLPDGRKILKVVNPAAESRKTCGQY